MKIAKQQAVVVVRTKIDISEVLQAGESQSRKKFPFLRSFKSSLFTLNVKLPHTLCIPKCKKLK